MKADAAVQNHGSIFLVEPLTPAAEEWLEDNVAGETQHWGSALVVEHRYINDLVAGMQQSGLVVA